MHLSRGKNVKRALCRMKDASVMRQYLISCFLPRKRCVFYAAMFASALLPRKRRVFYVENCNVLTNVLEQIVRWFEPLADYKTAVGTSLDYSSKHNWLALFSPQF